MRYADVLVFSGWEMDKSVVCFDFYWDKYNIFLGSVKLISIFVEIVSMIVTCWQICSHCQIGYIVLKTDLKKTKRLTSKDWFPSAAFFWGGSAHKINHLRSFIFCKPSQNRVEYITFFTGEPEMMLYTCRSYVNMEELFYALLMMLTLWWRGLTLSMLLLECTDGIIQHY